VIDAHVPRKDGHPSSTVAFAVVRIPAPRAGGEFSVEIALKAS